MKVRTRRRLGWALVTAAALGGVWASFQQYPYVILSPGPTVNVLGLEDDKPVIQIEPSIDQEPPGEIRLLTVSEFGSPEATPYLWDLVLAYFSEDKAIYPLDLIYPDGKTSDDLSKQGTQQFNDSQNNALSAAATVLPEGLVTGHKITFAVNDIGGPSGGLAFTLGLIDKLSAGSLTGGKTIAVTGTIDANGVVGPIGGIRQKVYGAANAGANFMLVPLENCADLTNSQLSKIRVIPVSNLNEALLVLQDISSDHKPDRLAVCNAD